jgi:hypothetical protein
MAFLSDGHRDPIPQTESAAPASAQGRIAMSAAHASPALPPRKPPKSVRAKKVQTLAELYAQYETLGEQAKALYDQKDATLKKLVRAWKKDRRAKVDEKHYLDIEDKFRGEIKAFAPGFAHRYTLKLRTIEDAS